VLSVEQVAAFGQCTIIISVVFLTLHWSFLTFMLTTGDDGKSSSFDFLNFVLWKTKR
jgi:hypothetical protein